MNANVHANDTDYSINMFTSKRNRNTNHDT